MKATCRRGWTGCSSVLLDEQEVSQPANLGESAVCLIPSACSPAPRAAAASGRSGTLQADVVKHGQLLVEVQVVRDRRAVGPQAA